MSKMEFQPGDIVGVGASCWWEKIIEWFQMKLLTPATDRVHFFLVGEVVNIDNDWVIYEFPTMRSMKVGRVSQYKGRHIEVHRPRPDSRYYGERAVQNASKYGRSIYEYRMFFWWTWDAFRYWFHYGPGRIPWWAFRDPPGTKMMMCSELVCRCYEPWVGLAQGGIAATPSALKHYFGVCQIEPVFEGAYSTTGN